MRKWLSNTVQQRKKDKETFSHIPDADTKTDIVVSFYDEKNYGLTEAQQKQEQNWRKQRSPTQQKQCVQTEQSKICQYKQKNQQKQSFQQNQDIQ